MAEPSIRQAFEKQLLSKQVQKLKADTSQEHEIPDVLRELMSDESIEVMEHFGIECPRLLNYYCTSVEDALIESLNKASLMREQIRQLLQENRRLQEIVDYKSK